MLLLHEVCLLEKDAVDRWRTPDPKKHVVLQASLANNGRQAENVGTANVTFTSSTHTTRELKIVLVVGSI